MFGATNPTPYDLRFNLLGVPVRVHPLFWVLAGLLGISWNPSDPPGMMICVAVIFVSILVHEMGHALAMRYYGHNPSVVLYMGGGYATYQSHDSPWANFGTQFNARRQSPWSHIIISAAGPAAGFVLAGIAIIYVVAASASLSFFNIQLGTGNQLSGYLGLLVIFILFVNIFWGLVNLLPVYPLDGGQIAREVAKMISPYDGVRISLWISLITAAGVAVLGFRFLGPFIGIMFAYFAIMNWQMLQGPFGGGGGFGGGGYGGGGRPW